ncbi:alpha/beta fold hydrolase [Streptomyces sp. NPDC048331]|uniref:alpha/beta fold hydrolase n=1 Tax=Streptomyces sp. NPDC048331 TaxID=3365534 RepID=UPI0037147ADF
MASIGAPTLVLDGELDSTDITSNAQAIARTVPDAEHQRFASAAHMVNLESPGPFDLAVEAFLASTTDRT